MTMTSRPTRALRRPSPQRRKLIITAYALIAPFVVVFLAMVIAPLVYAGFLSLFQTRLIGGEQFVGLANFGKALTDPVFLIGVGRVTIFLLVQLPIMLGLALFFALAIDSRRMIGSRFSRIAIFVPFAVPGVVAALMWGYQIGRAHV